MSPNSGDNDNQDNNYTKLGSSITVTYHLNNQALNRQRRGGEGKRSWTGILSVPYPSQNKSSLAAFLHKHSHTHNLYTQYEVKSGENNNTILILKTQSLKNSCWNKTKLLIEFRNKLQTYCEHSQKVSEMSRKWKCILKASKLGNRNCNFWVFYFQNKKCNIPTPHLFIIRQH